MNETKDFRREDAIFCLVGNKIDLAYKRCISEEKGKNYAKDNEFIFTEVSAKDGIHIQELFNNELIPKITEKFKIPLMMMIRSLNLIKIKEMLNLKII